MKAIKSHQAVVQVDMAWEGLAQEEQSLAKMQAPNQREVVAALEKSLNISIIACIKMIDNK